MLIGYARVSTEEQNLDLQMDALRQAGCSRLYFDRGFSGALIRRPALDDALRTLQPNDTLVIWKLDRLGRSLSHLIVLIEGLEKRGVAFKSISEAIDTGNASGRLLFHVMGALAEFERSLISERTKAGMAAAKARGSPVGRPAKTKVG
jgi:DNA invertase Pin-like site-specific DNA recombinase